MTQAGARRWRRTSIATAVAIAAVSGVASPVFGEGDDVSEPVTTQPQIEVPEPPDVAVEPPVVAVGLPPVPPGSDEAPVVAVGLPPVPSGSDEPVVAVGSPPVPPAPISALASTVDAALQLIDDCL